MSHTKKISQIISLFYQADQDVRLKNMGYDAMDRQDKRSYALALLILKNHLKLRPTDAFYLAMLLHHTAHRTWMMRAQQLAEFAAQKQCRNGDWLAKAIFDRRLLMSGKPQRYGTQYKINKQIGEMELCEMEGGEDFYQKPKRNMLN